MAGQEQGCGGPQAGAQGQQGPVVPSGLKQGISCQFYIFMYFNGFIQKR